MDNKYHHHEGGGFMNGFLLGAIIGAAVVFFLFTDKGKKLLKTITEEGMEGFADLREIIQEELDDEEEYDEYEEEPRHITAVPHHTDQPYEDHVHEEHYHEQHPSKVKRFFKGIKRS